MYRLILFFIALFLAVECSYSVLHRIAYEKRLDVFLCSEDDFLNGDLVFRRGKSISSYAVLMSDEHSQSPYSHAGMIVKEKGCTFVVHAVPGESKGPDYVRKERIKEFLSYKKCARAAIYRTAYSNETASIAAEKALAFFERKILFDDEYQLNEPSKLYCTELIYEAFLATGVSLTNNQFDSISFPVKSKILFPGTLLSYAPLTIISGFNPNSNH